MEILKTPANKQLAEEPTFNSEDLLKVITAQLNDIREQKTPHAYEAYTSKTFREATSGEAFDKFIHENAAFSKNASANFLRLVFNNNIGTFKGTLTTRDGVIYPVEYDLILEDGQWKILHIQIYNPEKNPSSPPETTYLQTAEAEAQAAIPTKPVEVAPIDNSHKPPSLEITKAVVGTKINPKGFVQDPSAVIKTTAKEIFINVFVQTGKIGDKIELTFKHQESHSQLPPISTNLHASGDSVVSFVFSAPPKGWPKGHYELLVTTSTGLQQIFTFEVN